MNNMKKALALVMSLALAASTFVVGAAYDDVPNNHENRVAINLLGDLGVMVGDAGTNDFRPEGTLKRSEAAAIVYRLRTGKTNADSYVGSTGFSDVSDSHWASGYINYCVEQGIIAGYPDGTFKPDQEVTYAEYIKMVVCALNLQKVETTTYIDMNTGVLVSEDKITTNYPNGYIALASDQSITEGLDHLQPNDKITRAEVAQGSYNAIFEAYYKNDAKDTDYVKDKNNYYQHLAEQVFKLEKTVGIVTAYEDYGTGKEDDDNFALNIYNEETKEFEGSEKSFEYAGFDKNLVGQKVYIWEKVPTSSSAQDKKVIAVVAHEDNTSTTINVNDLKKDDDDFYYTNEDGKKITIDGTTKTADLNYYVNGAAVDFDDLPSAMKQSTLKGMLGVLAENKLPVNITIIDSDASVKSPTAIKFDVYGRSEVSSMGSDYIYIKPIKDIYADYSAEDITPEGTETALKTYQDLFALVDDTDKTKLDLTNTDGSANDKIIYPDDLEKEDKIMVYRDVNGVVEVRKMEIVEDTLNKIKGGTHTIGDVDYAAASGKKLEEVLLTNQGDTVKAYIDPFTGYIVDAEEGTGSVEDYYYVYKMISDHGDYSIIAYDYEGNKVTLKMKNSTVAEDVYNEAVTATGQSVDAANFDAIDASKDGYVMGVAMLKVNSSGQVTGFKDMKADPTTGKQFDADDEYNEKTGLIKFDDTQYEVKSGTVVFAVSFNDDKDHAGDVNLKDIDEVKTYVGTFPKMKTMQSYYNSGSTDIPDIAYIKDETGSNEMKAGLVYGESKGSVNTDIAGYVFGVTIVNDGNDKGHLEFDIATQGEVKTLKTETVDSSDLPSAKDAKDAYKEKYVTFDLTTDGLVVFDGDYGSTGDIKVMGSVSENAADKLSIFKDSADTSITLGSMDDDKLYAGYVAKSKNNDNRKYITLASGWDGTDFTGSVSLPYADDCKFYIINEDGDAVEMGSAASVSESTGDYARTAFIKVNDGDKASDTEVVEVYYREQYFGTADNMTSSEKREAVDEQLKKIEEKQNATVAQSAELNLASGTVSGVTMSYSLDSAAQTYLETDGTGKLKFKADAPTPAQDTVVKVTVTATCGDKSDTKVVEVTIKGDATGALNSIVDAVEAGTYKVTKKDETTALKLPLGNATITSIMPLGNSSNVTVSNTAKDVYVKTSVETDETFQVVVSLSMNGQAADATINVSTEVTAAAKAAFEAAYAEVSALEEASVTEDDLTKIQAALDAYDAVPSAAQGSYSSQKGTLDTLKTAAVNDQKVKAAAAQYAKYTAEGGEKITVSGSKGSATEITDDVKTAGEDGGTAWDAVSSASGSIKFSDVSGQLDVTTDTQLKINNSTATEDTTTENVTITFTVGSGNNERTATVTVVLDLTVSA